MPCESRACKARGHGEFKRRLAGTSFLHHFRFPSRRGDRVAVAWLAQLIGDGLRAKTVDEFNSGPHRIAPYAGVGGQAKTFALDRGRNPAVFQIRSRDLDRQSHRAHPIDPRQLSRVAPKLRPSAPIAVGERQKPSVPCLCILRRSEGSPRLF